MISVRADASGGPRHILTLVNALQALDPEIKLFGAFPCTAPDDLYTQLRPYFFDVFCIPNQSFSLRSLLGLRRFILQNGVTIVHSHGFGAGLYSRLLKLLTAFRGNPSIVHTFHGLHTNGGFRNLVKILVQIVLRPLTDAFIAVAEQESRIAKKFRIANPANLVTIPNGIKVPQKIKLQNNEKPYVIGSLSRLDSVKNPGGLVRIFEKLVLNASDLSLELRICGNGIDRLSSDSSKIFFLPPTSTPQGFLAELDLYVSNSRAEGLPLAVLEAMAVGVPCLLSKIPGHQLFIENKIASGFDVDDDDSFQMAVRSLFGTSAGRREIAERAHRHITEHHSDVGMAQKVMALYRRLRRTIA